MTKCLFATGARPAPNEDGTVINSAVDKIANFPDNTFVWEPNTVLAFAILTGNSIGSELACLKVTMIGFKN